MVIGDAGILTTRSASSSRSDPVRFPMDGNYRRMEHLVRELADFAESGKEMDLGQLRGDQWYGLLNLDHRPKSIRENRP